LRRVSSLDVESSGPCTHSGWSLVVRTPRKKAIVPAKAVYLLVVPGADRWEKEPVEPALTDLLQTLDHQGVPIAAICAATAVIARLGLIRGRRHTSNGLSYLRKQVPGYADDSAYVDAPAVRDQGLITASGLGDVEFASEIMAELGVLSAKDRRMWTTLFRSGRLPGGAAQQQ
jgi:putative intracellular protease/amidase